MNEKALTMGAGRTLFKQGEKGGDLYFIMTGQVELTVRDEATGAEAVVALLGNKSVIGSMSFLEGDPRSATATVKSEIKYIMISQGQRDKLLQEVPSWLQVLVKDLSANMRRLNEGFIKLKAENSLLQKKCDVKDAQIKKLEELIASKTPKS
ncbi:MAG: cyclic nucleotide-binding domain-containing protein [Oligoflexales bacterium]|nr:cyclic nucleotide-binding domain-containing protein [Oligoflexales bacterium]